MRLDSDRVLMLSKRIRTIWKDDGLCVSGLVGNDEAAGTQCYQSALRSLQYTLGFPTRRIGTHMKIVRWMGAFV